MIVLHGLGADGNDFVPIAHELDLGAVGAGALRLPARAVAAGDDQRRLRHAAWYDILGLDSHAQREDEAGPARLAGAGRGADRARRRRAASRPSRIVLAGFSQGCAMTLMTGLRHDERLAGLVGLSGYLPLAAKTEAERHARQPRHADLPRPRHASIR